MELLCGMVWILKQRTCCLHLQDGSYLASRVSERHRLLPTTLTFSPIIISFNALWLMCFCLLELCLLCWTCAGWPDKWEQEGGKRCSLTADIANCHSVIAFKGTRAGWRPGATDGQLGGSAFESQWHLQYGQSGAQQAHQSQSPFPWRYTYNV